jgi:hypothetical protein
MAFPSILATKPSTGLFLVVSKETFAKLFKAVKQIAKKEKVKRMLTHVTSGANISLTDRFFRKIGVKTLGGNYAFKL